MAVFRETLIGMNLDNLEKNRFPGSATWSNTGFYPYHASYADPYQLDPYDYGLPDQNISVGNYFSSAEDWKCGWYYIVYFFYKNYAPSLLAEQVFFYSDISISQKW